MDARYFLAPHLAIDEVDIVWTASRRWCGRISDPATDRSGPLRSAFRLSRARLIASARAFRAARSLSSDLVVIFSSPSRASA